MSLLPTLQEMQALSPLRSIEPESIAFEVSLLIPARASAHALEQTVKAAHEFLSRKYSSRFEIILIPNPKPGDASDPSIEIADQLARSYTGVRSVPHTFPPGKGAALRTGFAASRGKYIFFTDADLPYDLEFFERATVQLQQGHGLVTGNRRLDISHFNVPVELLKLAYGRHRLGLLFNRVVRWLLPIATTDTQAGIKAMSRPLATVAFSRQACPGFFFDLELFLAASANRFSSTELPVTLFLNTEKSTVRVIRESILAGFWLCRIALRNALGRYRTDYLALGKATAK